MEVLHIAFVVLHPNNVALSVLAIVKGFREFCAVSVKKYKAQVHFCFPLVSKSLE